jgi:hypothetical protein
MDSGHPLFLLVGDDLTFVCPARGYYYSEKQATGYICAYYKSLIQQVMDGLSAQHGTAMMALEDFDLSGSFVVDNGGR